MAKVLKSYRSGVFALLIVCMSINARLHAAEPLSSGAMVECADLAVSLTKRVEKIDLDYSPASLRQVDQILIRARKDGLQEEQTNTLVGMLGCYVGEVFVRNLNGKWLFPTPEEKHALGDSVFVKLENGKVVNPIGKVRKLFQNGIEDSVAHFYSYAKAYR